MSIWTGLAVLVAIFALAYNDKFREALSWHPLLLNVAVIAGAIGVNVSGYFIMMWLYDTIGLYPTSAIVFGILGTFFIGCRLATGRWPW